VRDADDPEDVRLRLRAVLCRLVDKIWVLIVRRGSYRLAAAQVHFAGGKWRDYLIVHQTAGFRRQGGWEPLSPPTLAGQGALDLSKPAHVARLEKALLAMPLPTELGNRNGDR
jgi:hypothetical protein